MVPAASHRVSRVRWYSGYATTEMHFEYEAITLYGPAFQLSSSIHPSSYWRPQPQVQALGLGLSPFARRYWGNRDFFLFLLVLRCFSSQSYLQPPYLIQVEICMYCHTWVAPFGDLRVNGYLLLTAAYRSLSRPSSAPSAKASALCSSSLDLWWPQVSNACGFIVKILNEKSYTGFLGYQLYIYPLIS